MNFIAVLDFENLDNALFLKSFAETLHKMGPQKGIILHADSAYTDRLIQTGMMRESAQLRSALDLNHRITTFLSDFGIACIGIHGFQKECIQNKDNELRVDVGFFQKLPPNTSIVLSNLVYEQKSGARHFAELSVLLKSLQNAFPEAETHIFSVNALDVLLVNSAKNDLNEAVTQKNLDISVINSIPKELRETGVFGFISKPIYNNNLRSFEKIVKLTN